MTFRVLYVDDRNDLAERAQQRFFPDHCDRFRIYCGEAPNEHPPANAQLLEELLKDNWSDETRADVENAILFFVDLFHDTNEVTNASDPDKWASLQSVELVVKKLVPANSTACVVFISSYKKELEAVGDDVAHRLAAICGMPINKVGYLPRNPHGHISDDVLGQFRLNKVSEAGRRIIKETQQSLNRIKTEAQTAEVGDIELSMPAGSFRAVQPRFGLSSIVLPDETKREIKQLLDHVRYRGLIYDQWGFAKFDPDGGSTVFNFYGVPGTGKTLCAEAIAHELGLKIIKANYAELESHLVGQTTAQIREVFFLAREQNAVLFFDEADCALGKRVNVENAVDQAVNNARAAMMILMQTFRGVLILSTNLPKNFDHAFPSRICHWARCTGHLWAR